MTLSPFLERRPRRANLHAGHLLGAAAFLALPLSILAPLALSPLLAVCALGLVLRAIARRERLALFSAPIAAVLAGGIVWMAISLAWAGGAERAPGKLVELALLFLAGGIVCAAAGRLTDAERRFLARALVAGVLFGLAFLAVETTTGAAVMGFLFDRILSEEFHFTFLNRAATVAALLVWPAVAVLLARRAWAWAAGVALVVLLVLPLQESGAALAAFLTGLAAFAVTRLAPRLTILCLATLVVVATLAAPFAAGTVLTPAQIDRALPGLPSSGFHRLEIWRFVATRVAERPILGWGFDSSRSLPGGQASPSERTGGGAALEKEAVLLPLHPHNAFLQWWLELGLPGALLGAAFLILLFRAALSGAPPAPDPAVASGQIMTALVIANLSYGIWQGWWQAALWLSAAFLIAAQPRENHSGPAP